MCLKPFVAEPGEEKGSLQLLADIIKKELKIKRDMSHLVLKVYHFVQFGI